MTDEELWAGYARTELSINTDPESAARVADEMLALHRRRWPVDPKPSPDANLVQRCQDAKRILGQLMGVCCPDMTSGKMPEEQFQTWMDVQRWLDEE